MTHFKFKKSKRLQSIVSVLSMVLLTIGIYSCRKHYIDHGFRQNYTNVNKVIHTDAIKSPFFKVHFKNGNVSVLESWSLNSNKDSILGQGKLYDFNRNLYQQGPLSINIDEIAIIETNQLDAIKAQDKEKIASLSILTGANVLLDIVCITNPKACFGSCPTFYVDGLTDLHNARAEGFSSAISPSLEKRDLDALQYSTASNEFLLTMKNEAFETHMINELFIQAIPKHKDAHIYHDKHGSYYSCGSSISPRSAHVAGKDIGNAINSIDDIEYFSTTDPYELATKETIILEFDNLPTEDYGLLINFRQSLLTTFLLYSGISYMGDEVGDYFTKIETSPKMKQILSNPFKRLGGITLSVWDEKNNDWQVFQELYETGPIAKNLRLAPLQNIAPKHGKLKLKIELAKGLWRLDYLGLTPIKAKVNPYTIYPNHIEVIDGEDYTIEDISNDDDNYLLSFPGNIFNFKFELPEIAEHHDYELFLSSKGYYLEWIRTDWIAGKNLPKLRKMLRNDTKTWRDLAQEFKTMEADMESVFWNSKYYNLQ